MNKEIENVLKLNNSKKYEYFIKKICAFGEVWALKDDTGWATSGMDDVVFFPVWAKKEYVDLCISDEWNGCKSAPIDIDEFLEDWIPGLKDDGVRISVMWNNGAGIDVDWNRLADDIETELEKY